MKGTTLLVAALALVVFGIAADCLVIVEGGYKEDLTVELWVVPSGVTPPAPSPP